MRHFLNHSKLLSLLLLFLSFAGISNASENNLLVKDAWIAEAPPVSEVMVAYLTVINSGDESIELTSARSDSFSSIEFHETVHEDGMARMIRYDSITIPPNSSVQFKRGGKHLMLFNPVARFKAGDIIDIELITKDASKTVSVSVKKPQF